MSISTVIFDFGNVVFRWDPAAALQSLYPNREAALDAMDRLDFYSWNAQELDGGADIVASLAVIAAENPERHALLRCYLDNIRDAHRDGMPGMPELIERLAGNGLRLLGMTNAGEAAFNAVRNSFPVVTRMEDIFVSGREQCLKPSAESYQRLLGRNGLAPAECLFVDDNAANVAGARVVGLDAVQFTDTATLEQALTNRGLL